MLDKIKFFFEDAAIPIIGGIIGSFIVELDLLLCDNCNNDWENDLEQNKLEVKPLS